MVLDEPSRVFILLSTALVHLMTPGLAFFYGGMVNRNSVLTVMLQSYSSMAVISILWFFVGFSLCYGQDGDVIGNPLTFAGLQGVNGHTNLLVNGRLIEDISGLTFCIYQLTFAVITPAIITGAFLDRLRYKAYIPFVIIWFFLVYCPVAHMTWGGGWLQQLGAGDYAGGTVVHITSGFSGLASPLVLGKRLNQPAEEIAHNVPFVGLGTALLWFGWFGFNGGSSLTINGSSASAAYMNSQLLGSACIGAIVGLVVITPSAGYVQPWAAVVMGPIVVPVCYSVCHLRRRYFSKHFDDALDVWGCHGMGGFVGCILVGVLSDPAECNPGAASGISTPDWCSSPNTISRSWAQVGKQSIAAVGVAAWSFIATALILKLLSALMVIRIPKGGHVDEYELGELAYSTAGGISSGDEDSQWSEEGASTPVQNS